MNDSSGNPFVTAGTITALEFAPSNPSVLHLGTSGGALYRATGGGGTAANWARIDTVGSEASAPFPNTLIAGLSVDPSDPDHVWVVFASDGVSFTSRPDMILNPLGISHVFRTADAGVTWNAFQEGLARSPVIELRLHRTARRLQAATMGRGVSTRQLG